MRISVIVPNYNHAPFLKQRLDSVLNQTFQDFEVVILDDCSTDNSREIIEGYRSNPKVKSIVYNQKNSGSPFKQWKKGIELAMGEYIWIAESDDWADENFLSTMVSKLSDETVSLAYCRTTSVAENEKQSLYQWGEAIHPEIWNADHTFKGREFINSFMKYRNVIPNASAVVFKKKYFVDIDTISNMHYAGDWFVWTNLASKGDIVYSAKNLNYYREHTATTRGVKPLKEEIRRIKEYFIVINNGCGSTGSVFKAFNKNYRWIIDEWLGRIKTFGMKKTLRPPYPFLFLIRFYCKLLTSKN